MKITIVPFGLLGLALGWAQPLIAQEDSSRLDLGYFTLGKAFSQQITIKGSDLEKMPFANLSDAIAAWLYGAYTQPPNLQYIVDGSPVADVNAYSVFDIEEVVLIENAAAEVYTGTGQQAVVLIRTRRGKAERGKANRGMTAAGQAGLVSGGIRGQSTDTRWYQQYYLGAHIDTGAWRFGASASWLRDVQPISGQYQIVTPDNLQRWRLHGYADWQPDKHDQLELAVGYVPQKFGLVRDSADGGEYTTSVRNSAAQRFFLPELRWRGEWLGGLTNQFQASYVQSVYQDAELTKGVSDTNSAYYGALSYNIGRSSYHVYVEDRLAYRLRAGSWRIEPAMHVSYEHVSELFDYTSIEDGNPQGLASYYNAFSGLGYTKYHVLFYTPQLDIHYKNAFDLIGGESMEAGSLTSPGMPKSFFFISGSFDALRLASENNASGLAFFGSYSQRAMAPVPGYQLSDLTDGYAIYNTGIAGLSTADLENFYYYTFSLAQRYWVWDAGVRYDAWKYRLQIQGNIERRNDVLMAWYNVPTPGNSSTLEESILLANETLLHLGIRATIVQGAGAEWQSGIHATVLYSKVNSLTSVTEAGSLAGYAGDVYPNPYSVTGGWVNRIRVDHFIGGLDLLYHFGETSYETAPGAYPVVTTKLSPVAVPNVYAGYRFDPAHNGPEIFAESRGLFRSNPSDLAETRRYYTIGGKLAL